MARSKRTEATVRAVIRQGEGATSQAGVGVDIIELDRMERVLARTPRFAARVFSAAEREYASKKLKPSAHLALCFAAKEAVLKALGTGFSGMAYTDVEVSHDKRGRPVPLLHGAAAAAAAEQGIVEVQLSLSYTHQVGVASAVAIKAADRPQPSGHVDPLEELNRQFKEMRAMLDDMDTRIKEAGIAAPPDIEGDSGVDADASASSNPAGPDDDGSVPSGESVRGGGLAEAALQGSAPAPDALGRALSPKAPLEQGPAPASPAAPTPAD